MFLRKMFVGGIIFQLFFLICIVLGILWVFSNYTNRKEVREEKIGESFILDGDTIQVVDYSLLKSTYTLQDGKEISVKLIDKLEQLKK